jgi:hypothetical protein
MLEGWSALLEPTLAPCITVHFATIVCHSAMLGMAS